MTHTLENLAGNADAFPVLRHWDFYNHAGVSPMPAAVAEVLRQYADHAQRHAYLEAGVHRRLEALRQDCARLINARPAEVAFIKNTSEGIATIAKGLETSTGWQAGDRVVLPAVEYPANIYPWFDLRQRLGVELVMIPQSAGPDGRLRVPLDRVLEAADHPRTRLVAISHVQYATGQQADLATLGRHCRQGGRLLLVDAIQSAGVLPIDVQAMNIDFLAAGGHKWLMGPEGTGFLYVRQELIERVQPLAIGWMNVTNADDYSRLDFTYKPDARRYECGTLNVPGLLGLGASLRTLLELGTPALTARLRELTDHLIALLESRGARIASPRGPGEDSGIVSFEIPGRDPRELAAALRRRQIEVVVRDGRLRASPHFYNTPAQLERLVEALGA
jgi:cysteine desulfurase/selenocysteine lyase